ncbi:MAG: CapA family protein [Alphaproteobacteria bacterium]|nr:CapA family protein [Alphaproteobacteria bacterium]
MPPAPTPEPERRLTLVAVGDVLPHRRVKAAAAEHGWEAVLAGVSERIAAADIAFANLESPVAPDHDKGVHGEVFNAPGSLVDGLAAVGFDVLSMANNHVWDQGADGMLETRDRVRAAGMQPVGVGETCAEAEAPVLVERNGIRVAFVALTDLVNTPTARAVAAAGLPGCAFVPGEECTTSCEPDRDALWYPIQAERVHAAIARARGEADVVVVSAHWQVEYITEPLPDYRGLAHGFLEAGADVVLGHHPHVLQPVETVGDGVIAYSLGNFVSDMGRAYDPAAHPVKKGDTRDGGVLELDVRVQGDAVRVTPRFHPTWTDNGDTIAVVGLGAVPEPLRSVRDARIREVIGDSVELRPQAGVVPTESQPGNVSTGPRYPL